MVAERNGGLRFDLGAFDLDGTLLRRNLEITARTLAAMGALRERGMRLVVATGRRYESAVEHAERLGFGGEDPVVCYGGSMVRRMDGETLLHRTLPKELGLEVLEWTAERNLHARVFVDGRVVTSPDSPAALRFMRRSEEPGVVVVDSPARWLSDGGEEPTKLVIVDHPDDVGGWLGEAQEAFRGRLFVTRSLPHYVEVGGLEGTKSAALKFLCERWGIGPDRVLAFGDADNDVDMLRFAGHGVAVGPLTDEVREAADEVVPNVDEDGVALYVEKLLGDLSLGGL
ncbi:MAG: Haloacid dehalogenase-like hydrolase [uncultured Rubrobacteraceae bacterium]|uniref:Haloacid dehalogenase-like hydrolase n=1 Tax=uncultured Rubrobacteraceae bacterium TaxID=349277 RepID=A0A6J4R2Z2_9ACTN|nr:MAG: Haloacid dehalogenase-like hydrolase [uncultured Rubrobacteraceae bacterium]